jgi:hypothetical protein
MNRAQSYATGRAGQNETLLTGMRSVPALAAGVASTGAVTVTIPTTMATGSDYLIAWADDLKKSTRRVMKRLKRERRLVRPARLERATSWFVARRSIQLSYGRANPDYSS